MHPLYIYILQKLVILTLRTTKANITSLYCIYVDSKSTTLMLNYLKKQKPASQRDFSLRTFNFSPLLIHSTHAWHSASWHTTCTWFVLFWNISNETFCGEDHCSDTCCVLNSTAGYLCWINNSCFKH